MAERILITGASGFIGSFIAEEALRRGFEVWAGVRGSSSRRYLQHPDIHFLELDFADAEQLTAALSAHQFDCIVHAAGATKCASPETFYRVNADGTRRFCEAVRATQPGLRRFVLLSSFSVMGAPCEQMPHREITITQHPTPNTHYAKSKLQGEEAMKEVLGDIPWVILRPTGVYGPRERDYLLMAKSIRGHVDFAVGYRRQDITFVYVSDVVQAVFLALERPVAGQTFFLSDGGSYRSSDFSRLIRRELGNPWCVRIKAPLWVLRLVCSVSDRRARRSGRAATLNNDKYHILKQRNWLCDIAPARTMLGYEPEYDLERGVRETMNWYKENGWL